MPINQFKVKLEKKIAEPWMAYARECHPITYKRKVQFVSGTIFYGCFPVKLEEIGENSTEVMATISYDHYITLPETIIVKDVEYV